MDDRVRENCIASVLKLEPNWATSYRIFAVPHLFILSFNLYFDIEKSVFDKQLKLCCIGKILIGKF